MTATYRKGIVLAEEIGGVELDKKFLKVIKKALVIED